MDLRRIYNGGIGGGARAVEKALRCWNQDVARAVETDGFMRFRVSGSPFWMNMISSKFVAEMYTAKSGEFVGWLHGRAVSCVSAEDDSRRSIVQALFVAPFWLLSRNEVMNWRN